MRITWAVLLGVAGTLAGAFGALMFGVSGLLWTTDGFAWAGYSDSDEGERQIGVGMGLGALAAWVMTLAFAAWTSLAGPERGRRARRIALGVIVAVSAIVVIGLCLAALFTPQAPSEYPLPEWNRA
jgi:hypothetical protein